MVSSLQRELLQSQSNCLVWGRNDDRQLGIHNTTESQSKQRQQNCLPFPSPLIIDTNSQIIDAACGSRHSLFLNNEGKIFACGWNEYHQCLPVHEAIVSEPIQVSTTVDIRFVQVDASYASSYALSTDGIVYSWGKATNGMLGYDYQDLSAVLCVPRPILLPNQRVTMISAGHQHCLVMTNNCQVFSWGRNEYGQLGIGTNQQYIRKPTKVPFNLDDISIESISAGRFHSLALASIFQDNKRSIVYTWGNIEKLGEVKDTTKFDQPQEDLSISNKILKISKRRHREGCKDWLVRLVQVSAGGEHNLALTSYGNVLAWGRGAYGQLGNGHVYDLLQDPCIVNQVKDVVTIQAGLRSSFAIARVYVKNQMTFQLVSWGYNCNGELGLGDLEIKLQPYHVESVGENRHCLKILCGNHHNILLTKKCMKSVMDDMIRNLNPERLSL